MLPFRDVRYCNNGNWAGGLTTNPDKSNLLLQQVEKVSELKVPHLNCKVGVSI